MGVKVKKTVDFTNESIELLKEYSGTHGGISTNRIINKLIMLSLSLDKELKRELANSCIENLEKMNEGLININSYSGIKKEHIKKQYRELIKFFNDNELVDGISMKKVNLKRGYVTIPYNWSVLKESMATECSYAGIIEVKSNNEYILAHYIFFSKNKINILNSLELKALEEEYYQEIFNEISTSKNFKALECDNFFKLEFFEIPEYEGDKMIYPFGAMII